MNINRNFQMHGTAYHGTGYLRHMSDPSLTLGIRTLCSSYTPQVALYAASYYCHSKKKGGLAFEQRAQASRISIASAGPPYNLMSPRSPLCSVGVAVQRKEQSPEAADMNRGAHTSKLAVDTAA